MSNDCEPNVDDGYDDSNLENDGLRKHYDAIILGTGLTESILACAIARTGRYVLHIDANDFYGRNDASHTLEGFLEAAKSRLKPVKNSSTYSPQDNNDILKFNAEQDLPNYRTLVVETPRLIITSEVPRKLDAQAQNEIEINTNENAESPEVSGASLDENIKSEVDIIEVDIRRLYPFNIDFPGSGLLLGSGSVVDCLIKSDVSKYLEFQSMEGLYFLKSSENSGLLAMSSVPRSRGEVFKTDLLTILEKRSLMKFLQVVSDWGHERDGVDATTLNEKDLASGRSLHRPQNKEVVKSTGQSELEKYLDAPFHKLLSDSNLSTKLQEIVAHALCLYSHPIKSTVNSEVPTLEGLSDLYAHLASLGKFGDGAFLAPTYGIGDISQAFCRMCAVWAGVYILRCGAASISCFPCDTPEVKKIQCKVEGVDDLSGIAMAKAGNVRNLIVNDTLGHEFSCERFISNIDDWPSIDKDNSRKYILTYTGIFNKSLMPVQRSVGVIPPSETTIGNTNSIFIIQKDSTTLTTPVGYFSVSISTEVNYPVDKIEFDEFDAQNVAMMRKVVSNLLRLSSPEGTDETDSSNELCFAITVRPLTTDKLLEDIVKCGPLSNSSEHIALCGQTSCGVSMSNHVIQAQNIFKRLYPEEEFLKAFKDVDNDDEIAKGVDVDEEYDFSRLETALNNVEAANIAVTGSTNESAGDSEPSSAPDPLNCKDETNSA